MTQSPESGHGDERPVGTRAECSRRSSFQASAIPPARLRDPRRASVGSQRPRFTARGYIIKQDDSGSDPTAFLVSIDTIEAETGLDFFADLDDEVEEELESKALMTLWVDSDP